MNNLKLQFELRTFFSSLWNCLFTYLQMYQWTFLISPRSLFDLVFQTCRPGLFRCLAHACTGNSRRHPCDTRDSRRSPRARPDSRFLTFLPPLATKLYRGKRDLCRRVLRNAKSIRFPIPASPGFTPHLEYTPSPPPFLAYQPIDLHYTQPVVLYYYCTVPCMVMMSRAEEQENFWPRPCSVRHPSGRNERMRIIVGPLWRTKECQKTTSTRVFPFIFAHKCKSVSILSAMSICTVDQDRDLADIWTVNRSGFAS